MKELNCIEVIAEKSKYAKYGIHKGMQGWICNDDGSDQLWLVNFPQYGEKGDIATICIKEEDMKIIPKMDARINEQIKAQFDNSGNSKKGFDEKADDLSGYLV